MQDVSFFLKALPDGPRSSTSGGSSGEAAILGLVALEGVELGLQSFDMGDNSYRPGHINGLQNRAGLHLAPRALQPEPLI